MITDLSEYQVDPVRGFLPSQNPTKRLPAEFEAWEHVATNLSSLIIADRLRPVIEKMKIPDLDKLESEGQWHRAMLLLSVFGNAYIWGSTTPIGVLPRALAIPWVKVAEYIGRPMITSHASVVLDNWHLFDENGPIALDNLYASQLFLGGMDEAWFYLTTVAIEARGAAALPVLVDLQHAVDANRLNEAVGCLKKVAAAIKQITDILLRIPERCAPYVFYHRVRPFLAGWEEPGIVYEGVSDQPVVLFGGSAAQSSLLQAIDAGLSVTHEDEKTRPFLIKMRDYMPPPHKQFIEALESGPSVHAFVLEQSRENPALQDHYNACIDALCAFRKKHMEITVRYIKQQAATEDQLIGTGGTDFIPFLKEATKESREKLIS